MLEITAAINHSDGYISDDLKNEKAMLAMVALGVGEMLGGQLIG